MAVHQRRSYNAPNPQVVAQPKPKEMYPTNQVVTLPANKVDNKMVGFIILVILLIIVAVFVLKRKGGQGGIIY